jgi:DNA-directed RNA polymerase beta' subunit
MNIQVVDQRLESNPRYQAVVKAVHRYQQALVAERKKNIEQAQKSVALANAAKNLMVAIGNSTNMTQVRQILAQYGYTEDQQGKEGHKAQKAKD